MNDYNKFDTRILRDLAVRSNDGDLRGAALYAADTIDAQTAQLEAYPADWRSDSSLETWFLLTAEQLKVKAAEIARLREALGSIRQYGNDTLSGRADGGPDDRKWQREAVIEMRNRARAALAQEQGESDGNQD